MPGCEHDRIEVISRCSGCGQELGRGDFNRSQLSQQGLSQSEIAGQGANELPDREAMSLANLNVAVPINLAAALNVLSDGSIAAAAAQQTAPIGQAT